MPRLELYPFRYRSEVTGKMVLARYVAELHEIAARHAEFEIVGAPEIRNVDPVHQWFNPWRPPQRPKRLRYPVIEAS